MTDHTIKTEESRKITRPPVVVVMGHIDHGKTTLLDYIRKSNVAGREAGSITQHVGAYEVAYEGRAVTFLDTPGHEAFSNMRRRGARIADIAILVVAADDGVKPQTLEAFRVLEETKTPFVVAINKIDKPGVNVDRVKKELAEHNILLEGWGGTVPVAPVSAKTGEGVAHLLELVGLLADVEELTADPRAYAEGIVIESRIDARRGVTATLLVQNGTLHVGDWIQSGEHTACVRILEDFEGAALSEAGPSRPVCVLGFSGMLGVGELFHGYREKKAAEEAARPQRDTGVPVTQEENSSASLSLTLVLKADVAGSLEALEHELRKIHVPEITLRILRSGVGDISEDDVKLVASHRGAVAAGFHVKIASSAATLAERSGVTLKTFHVIYELIEWLTSEMQRRVPPRVERVSSGKMKVLKIFGKEGARQIVGGRIITGNFLNGMNVDLLRDGERMGGGRITNLQQNKVDVSQVPEKSECGVALEMTKEIRVGDVLDAYTESVLTQGGNT